MSTELQRYRVGGCVRDALIGRPCADNDWVVVGATIEQMQDLGFTQVGRDFPVFLHPETHEEHALARTERKKGLGHHGFEVFADPSVTLEEDLVRRDLTINAMAQGDDGGIVDPFEGRVDLEKRILRHVSSAFAEDPLRVYRVARFAAQLPEFEVAPETFELMRGMIDELATLSPERVWQELEKALNAPKPIRFFQVLEEIGATSTWFAELAGATPAFVGVIPDGAGWLRFAQLPLTEQDFRALAGRLKAPGRFLQCALDCLSWADICREWREVDLVALADALDTLKVVHEMTRLEEVLAFVHLAHTQDFEPLRAIAQGYRGVRVYEDVKPGPAYGQMLRDKRMAWLDQQRLI